MEKEHRDKSIHLENLVVGYVGKHQVIRVAGPITANLYGGELTCLLGPNGIGKSTLLRTLCAFQPKLSGDIIVQGRPLESYKKRQLAEVIGVVLTERCDIRNMTVREVTGLGRSPYTGFWGILSDADNRMVEHSMELVGIEHLAERMVHTLSDGERQKVMIARALVQDTPVVFLDEPTSFLDFPSKVEMMQLLHRLSRVTRKTIFLSTHDLELALQLADKVWLMDRNRGVLTGTPEDLALNGSLEHFFVRKGIAFNKKEGVFRVDHECTRRVALTGSGMAYDMVRKALLRNGISVSCEGNEECWVKADSEDIEYGAADGGRGTVDSIEELLDRIL